MTISPGFVDKSLGAYRLRRVRDTQPEIARKCGVDQSTVSRWRDGLRQPSFHGRMCLERFYGIPAVSWDERPPPEPETPSLRVFRGPADARAHEPRKAPAVPPRSRNVLTAVAGAA